MRNLLIFDFSILEEPLCISQRHIGSTDNRLGRVDQVNRPTLTLPTICL
jgi:hypothetical protein